LSSLALPVTLLYLVPLPLLAFMKLLKSDRGSDQVLSVYGFLFSGYKDQYWYWELVVLVRKILVAAISVFLSSEVSSGNDLQVNSCIGERKKHVRDLGRRASQKDVVWFGQIF
jgi:hypothetical protein